MASTLTAAPEQFTLALLKVDFPYRPRKSPASDLRGSVLSQPALNCRRVSTSRRDAPPVGVRPRAVPPTILARLLADPSIAALNVFRVFGFQFPAHSELFAK